MFAPFKYHFASPFDRLDECCDLGLAERSPLFYGAQLFTIDAQCDQTIGGGSLCLFINLCDGKFCMQCAFGARFSGEQNRESP